MISKIKGIEYNPPRTVGSTTGYGSSTAEVVVNSLLIPVGSLKQYDLLGIDTRLTKVGTNATVTLRIRIGATVNTSQQLVATYASTAASNALIPIMRRLSINNLSGSTYVPERGTSNSWDFSGHTFIWEEITTISWEINQYIIVTAQCGSALDTVYCPHIITDFIQGS